MQLEQVLSQALHAPNTFEVELTEINVPTFVGTNVYPEGQRLAKLLIVFKATQDVISVADVAKNLLLVEVIPTNPSAHVRQTYFPF